MRRKVGGEGLLHVKLHGTAAVMAFIIIYTWTWRVYYFTPFRLAHVRHQTTIPTSDLINSLRAIVCSRVRGHNNETIIIITFIILFVYGRFDVAELKYNNSDNIIRIYNGCGSHWFVCNRERACVSVCYCKGHCAAGCTGVHYITYIGTYVAMCKINTTI